MAAFATTSPSSSSDPVVSSPRPTAGHAARPNPAPPPPPPDLLTASSLPMKPPPVFPQPSSPAPLLGRPVTPPPAQAQQPVKHRHFHPPPTPHTEKAASIAGAAAYIRGAMAFSAGAGPRPPFIFADQIGRQPTVPFSPHFVVPQHIRPSAAPAPMKNATVNPGPPKVAAVQGIPSSSEFNNYKERDSSREDIAVTIQGRKVRLSKNGSSSLYALCRSWVRSGMPQENQPVFEDSGRLLPRPLPESFVQAHSSIKIELDSEDNDNQDNQSENSVEHLSTKELLERHIKHAKKVRANLRKKRLLRIERYKQRLGLLLPPPIELGKTMLPLGAEDQN